MPFFRKRPVVVEAEQFFEKKSPLPFSPDPVVCYDMEDDYWYVITIHGQETIITDGDWIIRETGTRDRAYSCKSDIFDKTYEPISD